MQFIAIDRYFRKRSSSSSIFLHIPLINFIGFLFQLRGAYIAVKNYCYINQEVASFSKVLFISLRFAFFGAFWSVFIFVALLLFFDANFVGPMAAYYLGIIGDVFSSVFSIETSAFLFGELPAILSAKQLTGETFLYTTLFLIVTYIIFGLMGSIWAIVDLKSDLRRSYAKKSLFDIPAKTIEENPETVEEPA